MASNTPSPTFSETTFSEDLDHWQEVDRITEQYRVAIQNEEKYIYESAFTMKSSAYKIKVGFSGARNNVPAVKILMAANELVNKAHNISFDVEEWHDFITYLKQFSKNYFDTDSGLGEEEMKQQLQFSNYIICTSQFMGNKFLKVTNDFVTFYICENTVREFINISGLINSNLNVLNGLDFNSFYNNFLNVTNNILCESNYELRSDDVMLNLCDLLPHSIQMHCIRECLHFNRDKVMNDLDRKMFILNS